MKYKIKVLFKDSKDWMWLTKLYSSRGGHLDIKESHSYSLNESDAPYLDGSKENVLNVEEFEIDFCKPVEAFIFEFSDFVYEIRRNPHKLTLGIEEFQIINKYARTRTAASKD